MYRISAALAPFILVLSFSMGVAQDDLKLSQARERMVVEDLEKEGIKNPLVLKAMRTVPRHLFVAPPYRHRAYDDAVLPIGHRQTISPPYIVAYMTEVLDPQPNDRVLEIGTGSGYQAAVLGEICKEVHTIEIVEPLGKQAAQRLQELGYKNVKVKIGDGYKGWPEFAPFDKIIVTCSPESVPQPLVDQLREGGRMIIPLGERFQQVFHLLEKQGGKLKETRLVPTFFVPMTGQAEDRRKVKPDGVPRLMNGGFEKHVNFHPEGWYGRRQALISQVNAKEGISYAVLSNDEPGRPVAMFQGLGLDGKKFRSLHLSAWVKGDSILKGETKEMTPCVTFLFLDTHYRPLSDFSIWPFSGTFPWRRMKADIPVPLDAEAAVIRIGLNGGTGSLGIDDVRILPAPR